MNNEQPPMKKYADIQEDDKRAKTPKTAKAKEADARKTSIKREKR